VGERPQGHQPALPRTSPKLYGVTIAQLGIEPDAGTAPDSSSTDRSLLAFLDTATGLLDQLGAAGAVLAPQMFALWKDEITNRRAMFALLDPLAAGPAPTTSGPLDLDGMDQLADQYESLYATADPAALLTPVAAHVRMLGDALRGSVSPGDRQRLLRNGVRAAILAGRIAFEKLHNSMSARAFYSVAYDDARELGDDVLRATVLGRTAQLAAAEGRTGAARDDLATAAALLPPNSAAGRLLDEIADALNLHPISQRMDAA
jgi:hypothetical protein